MSVSHPCGSKTCVALRALRGAVFTDTSRNRGRWGGRGGGRQWRRQQILLSAQDSRSDAHELPDICWLILMQCSSTNATVLLSWCELTGLATPVAVAGAADGSGAVNKFCCRRRTAGVMHISSQISVG